MPGFVCLYERRYSILYFSVIMEFEVLVGQITKILMGPL